MVTWSRADLKNWAKDTLHRNYWRMVLVGFIMMIASGGLSGGSSRSLSSLQQSVSQTSRTNTISESQQFQRDFGNTINEISNSLDRSSLALAGEVAIILLIVMLVVMIISAVFSFFLIQPLVVGGRRFFSRSLVEDAQLNEITYGFTHNYINVVKNMFLMNLFIGLWSLLFVIPGIVKSYEYRMIPYLLGEHPEMSTQELFQASREMMHGQKWSAFVLDVSFVGWNILGLMTCGILFIFWVYPYIWLTNAALYHVLSGTDHRYGPQGGTYDQNGGYNQGNPYGQNGSYNQGNPYSQGGGYNQGNPYGQDGGYNQGNPYGQNTPYGQGYYTQNDTNGQGNVAGQWQNNSSNDTYGQENGNTQDDSML